MRVLGWGLICACLSTGCSDGPAVREPTAPIEPEGWKPGTVLASQRDLAPRGQIDVRGLIHAHSVYSHDACDGEPRDEQTDAINSPCFDDFRRAMCGNAHDFIMLTDHGDSFSRTEYPDTLLYRGDRGDELVERAGAPVANRAACDPEVSPDGSYGDVMILAGTESNTMSVGLEGHVASTEAEREAVYGVASSDAILTLKAQGAVVLAQHTEDWTPLQLQDLGFDGFEMYNLHANTITGAGGVFELVGLLNDAVQSEELDRLPHPDLILLNIMNEDARYLDRWAEVLAMGNRRVTTMGTDCHQNSFPTLLQDDERIDSYRRMMSWMSNHLLVQPEGDGSWDDTNLKDALRNGRLFGVFEVMGYPEGFDFHALAGGAPSEMGSEVMLSDGVTLEATMPVVRDLDPDFEQPVTTIRLSHATANGWEQLDEVQGDLSYTVNELGAYRIEVRMRPGHLRWTLGDLAHLADKEFVWIYSNAIYVR
jgi:hypothetical protein